MKYFLNRLREPSTWAGIGAVCIAGAQAVATRDPAAMGALLAGIVAVLVPDKKAQ